jgi:hypothetical protein
MWGDTLDNEQSPAAYLRRFLARDYPNKKFEVITLAHRGKYQLNELIDSVVTIPHWEPDLVVSWNGYNEAWYGEKADHYEGMP